MIYKSNVIYKTANIYKYPITLLHGTNVKVLTYSIFYYTIRINILPIFNIEYSILKSMQLFISSIYKSIIEKKLYSYINYKIFKENITIQKELSYNLLDYKSDFEYINISTNYLVIKTYCNLFSKCDYTLFPLSNYVYKKFYNLGFNLIEKKRNKKSITVPYSIINAYSKHLNNFQSVYVLFICNTTTNIRF
ncbi:MAG TPA: hypothetical protein PK993_05845 [Clostridia bacterium]|nr:hypothetical protein [Clostridia bacterium]